MSELAYEFMPVWGTFGTSEDTLIDLMPLRGCDENYDRTYIYPARGWGNWTLCPRCRDLLGPDDRTYGLTAHVKHFWDATAPIWQKEDTGD